jgi:DNA-binding NarL/FixJ family response regulator
MALGKILEMSGKVTMSDYSARILLIDDHALFRDSVARFLCGEPGFEVVGCCGTTGEALEILQTKTVDLVLLDFDLGLQSGLVRIESALSTSELAR